MHNYNDREIYMFRKSFIISAVLFVMFITACATVPHHTEANMMQHTSGSGYTVAIYRPALSPETAEMVQLAYQIQNFLIHREQNLNFSLWIHWKKILDLFDNCVFE